MLCCHSASPRIHPDGKGLTRQEVLEASRGAKEGGRQGKKGKEGEGLVGRKRGGVRRWGEVRRGV